jgi:hypothetical protein
MGKKKEITEEEFLKNLDWNKVYKDSDLPKKWLERVKRFRKEVGFS